MTTTIEAGFGSRLMARGFLLNNELTDFAFRRHADGRAGRQPGRTGQAPALARWRPTIVFDGDGGPALAIGSPGGSRIIAYVAKALVAHIDWGMDAGGRHRAPNVGNRNGPMEIEQGTPAEALDRRRWKPWATRSAGPR